LAASVRLPSLSWRRLVKALGRAGFLPVRQSGSHIMVRNSEGVRITVPKHDIIGKGLLVEIIAEAGITKEELLRLL
jgi:predicted RNA binding protein YcfA (HicA-like mRNA interferase family)